MNFFFYKKIYIVEKVCKRNNCNSFICVVTHFMVNIIISHVHYLTKDKQNIIIIFIFMKVKQILNSEDCDAFSGINILFALCTGHRKQYFARKFLINIKYAF